MEIKVAFGPWEAKHAKEVTIFLEHNHLSFIKMIKKVK